MKKEACIELKVDKTISCLAGYPNGYDFYKGQVENHFEPGQNVTIVIPDSVEDIAISFVQGFCKDLKKEIGVNGIRETITFKHKDENLVKEIYENIN